MSEKIFLPREEYIWGHQVRHCLLFSCLNLLGSISVNEHGHFVEQADKATEISISPAHPPLLFRNP